MVFKIVSQRDAMFVSFVLAFESLLGGEDDIEGREVEEVEEEDGCEGLDGEAEDEGCERQVEETD